MKRLLWRTLALVAVLLVSIAVVALIAAAVAPRQLLVWLGFSAANSRLVTGILVTGTPDRPAIYVTSSDPRLGEAVSRRKHDVDTNSGIVSRLTWTGSRWEKVDLVRGLPRSRADHASNGMVLSRDGSTLYVAQGSNTNKGAPSEHFGFAPEYALSGAILAIDLGRIGNETYDLPTLGDEAASGQQRDVDPFGGEGGRNQALLVPGGPVRVHAPGFRNPYDVVLTRSGRMYTVQNGANPGWGDIPHAEGPSGRCSNARREGGGRDEDTLHLVRGSGSYAGHPNPTRGNRGNTFDDQGGSPVVRANAIECDYQPPRKRGALASFAASTNGLAEYTASNLGGALDGDLLTASFDQRIYRLRLDARGERVARREVLATLHLPLDLTAQGDNDVFPGTIWVAQYASATYARRHEEPVGAVTVLEPTDLDRRRAWRSLRASGLKRQEVSYVALDERMYLAGGDRRHEVYDPGSDSWRDVAALPARLDHIQGVAVGDLIYYIGGLRTWPEPHASSVFVYDPRTDSFARGAPMPRGRGAGGVTVHGDKIYYAGGLHDGRAVSWFDVYDPARDRWERLPDMPRRRDHFQAVVVGGKLYAIGGRDVDIGTELAANDAYDFVSGSWRSGLAPLPTPRGGFAAAALGRQILVIGGETEERVLNTVEAYDTRANRWNTVDPMPTARHGIQAAVCGGALYVAAGGQTPGGDEPTAVHESYLPTGPARCGRRAPPLSPLPRFRSGEAAFTASDLLGTSLRNPTSLQFGPDGRLYVAQQDGTIKIYTVVRRARNDYLVTHTETITLVKSIPNHDDDGSSATDFSSLVRAVRERLGLL